MSTPETVLAFECPDCSSIYTDEDLVPLYECSRCGGVDTERRCEGCNLFAARAGSGCESCATECDEIEAVEDHDGALVLTSEWEPGAPRSERAAAARAQHEREVTEKQARARAEREAASEQVGPADLRVGDWIMDPTRADAVTQVVAIYDWAQQSGLVIAQYGSPKVLPVSPDTTLTRTPEPDFVMDTASTFGNLTFDPDAGPTSILSSTPGPGTEQFEVTLSHPTRTVAPYGGAPCLSIARLSGSWLTTLGVFVDRATAQEALGAWETIATALAHAQGVTATPDTEGVTVTTQQWMAGADAMGKPVEVSLTTSSRGTDRDQPVLNVNVSGGLATLADPRRLLAAVAAARAELGHLNDAGGHS